MSVVQAQEAPREASDNRSKLAGIRAAIENGTYETQDKIDYVVNRLVGVLAESPFGDEQ